MVTKIRILYAESIVTQVCNLVCTGCSTYSDLPHKGYKTWDTGKEEILPWLERVKFEHYGIMGGEPLINPRIKDWLVGIRELMPETTIRFPVNGTLLHKHYDLIDLLHELGNVIFKITVHKDDIQTEKNIKYVFDRFNWESIHEFGVDRYKTTNNFKFQINKPKEFFMTFKNKYKNAEPYNSNPEDAFEVCHQKQCPLLHNGRIYKCSTSGLMEGVLEKFNNPNYDKWAPYWNNNKNGSIGLNSCDREIDAFVSNIEKPHTTCQQCPSERDLIRINHLQSVEFRKNVSNN